MLRNCMSIDSITSKASTMRCLAVLMTVVDIPKHRCKIWCDAERLGQTCIHSNTFSSLATVRGFFHSGEEAHKACAVGC